MLKDYTPVKEFTPLWRKDPTSPETLVYRSIYSLEKLKHISDTRNGKQEE